MLARRLIQYGPRLINILHNQLPHRVISENGLIGGSMDGHLAEATVQHLIAQLLIPHIPSPDLLRNNVQVLEHKELGRCIPDVIIDRIGGSSWGYFELKTLLSKDSLTEEAVERDLRKLSAYKEAHPDAAAVFLLVGTRKRLFSSQSQAAWKKAGISTDETAFKSGRLCPQKLWNGSHIAIPCGYSGNANAVMTLTWEIQPADQVFIQSDTYQFLACMNGTQNRVLGW